MNRVDLAKWLAGHRPPPARVVAVVGGNETRLAVASGSGRWAKVANVITDLGAEAVRLYNEDGSLVDSTIIDSDLTDVAPADASEHASSRSGAAAQVSIVTSSDVARIISVVAETMSRVVRDASQAQSQAHAAAFKELSRVTEIATQRLISLEQFVQQSLANRAVELEEREQREKEKSEEERAVDKLMDHVAPKLADKFLGSGKRRRRRDDEAPEPEEEEEEEEEEAGEGEGDDDDDDRGGLNGANGAGRGARE